MSAKPKLEDLERRKHVRFTPDPLDVAYIGRRVDGEFKPEIAATIIQEAPMGGCGLVLRLTDDLQEGDVRIVKIGKLDAYQAVVRWRLQIDEEIMKIGFEFME